MEKRNIIMVADDLRTSQVMIQKACELALSDFECKVAKNGKEAIDFARQLREKLAVIFMDQIMPELPGTEAARKIRVELKLSVPIVMFSSKQREEVILPELEDMKLDFLPKPVTFKSITEKLQVHAPHLDFNPPYKK